MPAVQEQSVSLPLRVGGNPVLHLPAEKKAVPMGVHLSLQLRYHLPQGHIQLSWLQQVP